MCILYPDCLLIGYNLYYNFSFSFFLEPYMLFNRSYFNLDV